MMKQSARSAPAGSDRPERVAIRRAFGCERKRSVLSCESRVRVYFVTCMRDWV